MARGFLAGNRTRAKGGETTRSEIDGYAHDLYYTETDFQIVERVVEVAKKHGTSPIQIALAWILRQPGVTAPIIGASKMNHLEEAVAALNIELDDEECAYLEELYQPRPTLGHS